MKGNVVDIYKVYEGQEKNLVIPVYQRNYDWTVKQCAQLYDDVEAAVANGGAKHFFGAVVGSPEDSFHWVVIDGQQRLTSVSLLMLALVRSIEDGTVRAEDPALARRILNSYLVSPDPYGTAEAKVRLKPVKNDATAYRHLFEKDSGAFDESANVTANYRYFRDRLAKTGYTAEELWDKGICKLEVMLLDLEAHDEPQRIFESLNSTGLDLSEADKIRNFVLMGLPVKKQEWLYEHRWNEIEKAIDYRTSWFLRWYLVAKTGRTPNRSDVYEAFKAYAAGQREQGVTVEDILDDLVVYARICRALERADTVADSGDPGIDARLRRFNLIKGDVVLPVLMSLYRAAQSGETSWDDFRRVLGVLETYFFRRIACSLAANSLNKIFATLYGEMRKLRRSGTAPEGGKEWDYADILVHSLLGRTGTGRFPRDEEFAREFSTRDFYHVRQQTREYVFDALENLGSKDTVDVAGGLARGDISVEHIMPQTLSARWRDELGPDHEQIHETWLHRIANLTVTGYNSSYSNASFARKKSMEGGFATTPYRLNTLIRDESTWGPEQLAARDEELTGQAMGYWPLPETEFVPPAPVLPEAPMGDVANFTGRKIAAFRFGEAEQTVATWADMVEALLKVLIVDHRARLVEAAAGIKRLRTDLGAQGRVPRGWRRIDEGLAVEVGTATTDKIQLLRRIFAELELDTEDLVFILRRGKQLPEDPKTPSDAEPDDPESSSPYAEILKFTARFDEAAELRFAPEDTAKLCAEFVAAFEPFRRDDAAEVLGGANIDQFASEKTVAEMDADQVLAVISQVITLIGVLGTSVLHNRVVNGNLSAWLNRLAEVSA